MDNNLEINKEGTNKGLGLLQLGKSLGISREEIMACGDGGNDVEMLKEVGFAVAMANGSDPVKKAADFVTFRMMKMEWQRQLRGLCWTRGGIEEC